ncbi:MAG TPA: Zn-ribbon domain-containing OB-fold protein [Myxococcota bacterium]|nr:Zn-ribbon domain-containing OB-fold protein [Myxococcota bacterium]
MADHMIRLLPALTPENQHFWTGGAQGELRFLRCTRCRHLIHPPAPVCPECLSRELEVATVSGRGIVHTYTVNHQPWYPGMATPFVIAIVELAEQPGLRLTTNLVNCAVDQVKIGMPVRVLFENHDPVWIPLFEPAS